jgi:hypothetical protein
MNSPEMHLAVAGKAEVACDTCGAMFTPKRAWSRFCRNHGNGCRNAFHAAEARKEAIRQAAPALYEALVRARAAIRGNDVEHIWTNYPSEPSESLGQMIDKVLGALKPPVEPKALLEKTKP